MQLVHRILLAGLIALGLAVAAEAATITVCASGCTYNNSQLQSALQAASQATTDIILLQEGYTYVGKFVLPEKTCAADNTTCIIEIRTGVSATGTVLSTSLFPAANERACILNSASPPVLVCHASVSARFAKFQSDEANKPSIRTVQPGESGANCVAVPCIAKWYRLKWLEFIPQAYGGDALVHLGSNINTGLGIANDDLQNLKSEIPSQFILEQVVLRGDPITGAKRGLFIAAGAVTVQDSAFYDFKSLSEGQAILFGNTSGTPTLTNNHIEGNGENLMSGGDGQRASHTVTVAASPAPTTTGATLSAVTDLSVGQWVTVLVGAVAQRTRIDTIVGAAVTFTTHPLTAAPDVPGAVKWSLVPTGGTVSKNLFYKPQSWRNPILDPPAAPTVTCATTGGTLAAGTYAYVVTARLRVANGGDATSRNSNEGTGTVASGTTGSCVVSWAAVATASSYRVYGRTTGAQDRYFSATAVTYTDTGLAGTLGTAPATGSVWQVKNIFELKNWDGLTIEGNVFDGVWRQAQNGYAITLTPTQQSGVSSVVKNITFRKNIVRNAAGGMQITACSAVVGELTGQSDTLSITDNLFYNIGDDFGSSLPSIWMGRGCSADTLPLGFATVTIKHNTILHDSDHPNADADGTVSILFDFWRAPNQFTISDLTITDNMLRRLRYSALGSEDASGTNGVEGTVSWDNITGTGTNTYTKNVLAGATCASYPGTNYCPTVTTWWSEFIDYAGGDFRLNPGSQYKLFGTDAKDLGADIVELKVLTDIALSGNNGTVPVVPVAITTTSLPGGTEGVAYSAPIIVTGGTAPYTCALVAGQGSLPANYSLSTACAITGTMALGAIALDTTYGFTVRATDSAGTPATDDQALTITVTNVSALVIVTTGPLTPAIYGQAYTFQMSASGGAGTYTWSACDATTLPEGVTVSSAGAIAWTPTSYDTVAMCLSVTDGTSVATTEVEIPVPGGPRFEEGRLAKVDGTAVEVPTCTAGVQRLHYDPTTQAFSCSNVVPVTIAAFYDSTWTNMPLAKTSVDSLSVAWTRVDLRSVTQVRFQGGINPAGAAAAILYVEYTADNPPTAGGNWASLCTTVKQPQIAIGTIGFKESGWCDIAEGAKADVVIRYVGEGGDGVADPTIQSMQNQVR